MAGWHKLPLRSVQAKQASRRSVADTSFVGESATMMAELRARLRVEGEARKRAMRRILAGAAVAVLHVIFALLLIASQWLPVALPKPEEIKPLMWVVLTQPAKAPKIAPAKPKKGQESGAITTIVPPRLIRPEEEENNAINLGLAIGRSLACGANSFEYLNTRQRAACIRKPWQFVYDRYGNIALDARERPVEEEQLRPSDIQAHERNTAPTCPQNVDPNAPCLSAIIGGHR